MEETPTPFFFLLIRVCERSTGKKLSSQMKEFSHDVVADVTTRKKQYVPPQIEVVELAKQSPLLSASVTSSRVFELEDISSENWDE